MGDREDLELVKGLLARGVVSRKQVLECIELQRASGGIFGLREVLEQKGYLRGVATEAPQDVDEAATLASPAVDPRLRPARSAGRDGPPAAVPSGAAAEPEEAATLASGPAPAAATPSGPHPAAPGDADDLVGREVAGFRVMELLGRGGMGAVYRALQLSL
ncbi:MAG: hypothetical protein HY722_14745, partial [Planctomycetes bacterium]|nr:hypothetical protein [Planctomycetota bacterium]